MSKEGQKRKYDRNKKEIKHIYFILEIKKI